MRSLTHGKPLKHWLGLTVTLSVVACATSTTPPPRGATNEGYVLADNGQPARDGSGRCMRTERWQRTHAIRECEPEMFARADAAEAEGQARRRAEAEAAAAEQRAKEEAEAEARRRAEAEAAEAEAKRRAEAEAAAAAGAAAVPKQEAEWHMVGLDVYFPTNQATLKDSSKEHLDKIARRAQEADEARISITGHADNRGNPDLNMELSQLRADAVRDYLVERGVPENIIEVGARGDTDPVLACRGRKGRALRDCLQVNRRSEIQLSVLEPAGQ